jgi:transaldolase
MNIKIFYDGVNIKDFGHPPHVVGFTTNLSYMAAANHNNYTEFAKNYLALAGDRPVSFQAWGETEDDIINQTKTISSWGDNVYVKIPIVQSDGSSNAAVIKKLHDEGYKINVTVVHTIAQIDETATVLLGDAPAIVSVFAGGICHTGTYPDPIVKHSVDSFKDRPNVETLWAGCQRLLNIMEADRVGCQIITIPDGVIKNYHLIGQDLHTTSVKKSKLFRDDAIKAGIHF